MLRVVTAIVTTMFVQNADVHATYYAGRRAMEFWNDFAKYSEEKHRWLLQLNLAFTFFAFCMLCCMVILIQHHHKIVTYWFWAGFFLSEMLQLIFQRDLLKKRLRPVQHLLDLFPRGQK